MGCFSFIKMDTRTNILMGEVATLLFPNGTKLTGYYDGYGRLNDVDVYAILAVWNRQVVLSNVDDLVYNDWVERNVNVESESMDYYLNPRISDDEVMSQILDLADDIRIIGIDLFFNHKDLIKYPLKFVDDPSLSYDDVEASVDDPAQGWTNYHLDDGYDENDDDDCDLDEEDRIKHLFELYQSEPGDLTKEELKELANAGLIDDQDDVDDYVDCRRCGTTCHVDDCHWDSDNQPLCDCCYTDLYK